MKTVLIIGYGSIGKRHATILSKFKSIRKIIILTKQKIESFETISNISQIKNTNPDYIVIASTTDKHFKYLSLCEKIFSKKIILIEKPLFNKYQNISIKKNRVFVGYNLRFHPVIQELKKQIRDKNIFNINIQCFSYLPDWRTNKDYTKTNSARKTNGGGVLLELSHELDFVRYLFGKYSIKYIFNKKIGNLDIDTDDVLVLNASIKNEFRKSILLTINLNFFSRILRREIIINGNDLNIHANLLDPKITIFKNNKIKNIIYRNESNKVIDGTYYDLHKSILKNDKKVICTYQEALEIMKDIRDIKAKNFI